MEFPITPLTLPITILCQSTLRTFQQLGGKGITTAIAVPTATVLGSRCERRCRDIWGSTDVLALLSPLLLLPLLPVGIEGLLLRGPCRKRRHASEIVKLAVSEIVNEIVEIVSEIVEINGEIVSEIGEIVGEIVSEIVKLSVSEIVSEIGEIVSEIVSEIGEILSEIGEIVGEIVSEIVSEIGKEEACNECGCNQCGENNHNCESGGLAQFMKEPDQCEEEHPSKGPFAVKLVAEANKHSSSRRCVILSDVDKSGVAVFPEVILDILIYWIV